MSQEYIWETFDSLFKTVYRQGRQIEELVARVEELEKKLDRETVNKREEERLDAVGV